MTDDLIALAETIVETARLGRWLEMARQKKLTPGKA